ncbi:AraC family transcriptional regulator [Psychrobacter sp. YP14]|uniref:GlxA family transcriptional regulator n=1 Tax=Psychrobacter sp. YP14 TaxID=2203895 RepID=UPI000D7E98A9|nr:GlxA family transcriptional regulator [Psychrobacter sp. YP14]AWT48714.1 AraC family transcriptional regulator [Psychrobacter sp. YP14]
MNQNHTIEIGLIVYEKAQMAAILGLTDLLMVASKLAAKSQDTTDLPLQVSHWEISGAEQRPKRTFSSKPDSVGKLAAIIIPPTLEAPIAKQAAAPWLQWLKEQHSTGTILSSVCAGAFLLGETGLLSKRQATTHWGYVEDFKQRFPDVYLDVDRIIIEDGDIVTAGGAMAWTDLGLRMIDRFLGSKVMNETARMLLIDPSRREQCYYSAFSPILTHGDAAILKVQHWLQKTNAQDIDLSTLAGCAGLEERTFLRRFNKATGMTSTEYCQRLRIGAAKDFLQFSSSPVEHIAWKVGYGDVSAFRKIFKRLVGLTPSEYRRRFNANKA